MIRPITIEDIPLCVSLICESFGTVAKEFGFTEENNPRFTAFATTEDTLRHQLCVEQRPMFVYEENGQIVGYYSLHRHDENACELSNLCVRPDFRHRKIGEELVQDAAAKIRGMGCRLMRIGIVEENQRLRRWYEGFGFVHLGTKKFDSFTFTCGFLEMPL
ncbi:MAG: GNAT family N-acetyltransferase [Ruminococcaceae bacterium]|nr:GNAT family N-acetyltransferase [Oscillospiraceae bacterium]